MRASPVVPGCETRESHKKVYGMGQQQHHIFSPLKRHARVYVTHSLYLSADFRNLHWLLFTAGNGECAYLHLIHACEWRFTTNLAFL
jgi:hypothetical protein